MTENEAIKEIRRLCCNEPQYYLKGERKCKDNCMYGENFCAFQVAIKALEEVQEYRALGAVEDLKEAKAFSECVKSHSLKNVAEKIYEYEKLGTVEEVREAVEKTKPKKCTEDSCPDHTHYKCPTCGKIQMSVYTHGFPRLGRIPNNCDNCGQELESEA